MACWTCKLWPITASSQPNGPGGLIPSKLSVGGGCLVPVVDFDRTDRQVTQSFSSSILHLVVPYREISNRCHKPGFFITILPSKQSGFCFPGWWWMREAANHKNVDGGLPAGRQRPISAVRGGLMSSSCRPAWRRSHTASCT